MQKISDVADGIISNPRAKFKYQKPFSNPSDPTTAKIINSLFLMFQGLCPAFKQAWPTETEIQEAKRQWVITFDLAGLRSVDDVRRGANKFRLQPSSFVPTPGYFIDLCRLDIKPQSDTRNKSDYALPTLEKERRLEVGRTALKSLLENLGSKKV